MSGQSVTVLTPNGRRQNVKITPNTTLLQILEQTCEKHSFNPADYDLKHHNKVIDINMIFRFSGLPNNAFLEMATAAKKRSDASVIIGLHLETGDRLIGEFVPTTTIYDVINTLKPDELTQDNVVVVYMSRKIIGLENLRSTTLKDLGLNSGRGMLRIIHKSAEEMNTQANVSAPLVRPPVEENTPSTKPITIVSPDSATITKSSSKENVGEEPTSQEKAVITSPVEIQVTENEAKPGCSKEENCPASEQPVKQTVADVPKPGCSKDGSNVEEEKTEDVAKDLMMSKVELERQINQFNESIVKSRSEINVLGERQAIAYSLDSIKQGHYDDLPDEFYELTVTDANLLLKESKRSIEELENSPLLTSSQRELEDNRRMLNLLHDNKTTILRIRFPDRTVLQGTFSPVETLGKVYEFVRSYLDNPQLQFYIYTTPPKVILDQEKRLFETNCVPSCVVYFGLDSSETIPQTFLRQNVIENFSTLNAACLTALESRGQLIQSTSTSTSTANKDKRDHLVTKSDTVPPNKIPKWFKP